MENRKIAGISLFVLALVGVGFVVWKMSKSNQYQSGDPQKNNRKIIVEHNFLSNLWNRDSS